VSVLLCGKAGAGKAAVVKCAAAVLGYVCVISLYVCVISLYAGAGNGVCLCN